MIRLTASIEIKHDLWRFNTVILKIVESTSTKEKERIQNSYKEFETICQRENLKSDKRYGK